MTLSILLMSFCGLFPTEVIGNLDSYSTLYKKRQQCKNNNNNKNVSKHRCYCQLGKQHLRITLGGTQQGKEQDTMYCLMTASRKDTQQHNTMKFNASQLPQELETSEMSTYTLSHCSHAYSNRQQSFPQISCSFHFKQ